MRISVPSGIDDVRLIGRTVRLVLTIPVYLLLAIASGVGFLTAMAVWEHWNIFTDLVITSDSHLSTASRLELFATFYPIYGDSFQPSVELALVVIAVMVGVNLTLLVYHVREHDLSASGGGASVFGVALGVLGAGCAACGSALLLGILSLVGAGGLVAILPLDGLEFTLVALLALGLSTYWIADGMRGGDVRGCPIDVSR